MPRKRKSDANTAEEVAPSPPKMVTRRSARLADVEEKQPQSAKKPTPTKRPKKTQHDGDNGKESPKKDAKDEVTVDGEASTNSKKGSSEDDNEFVHVNSTDAPAADSAEVKEAIAAQGEDGNLLVDYVQVVKDELPAENSTEVEHAIAKSKPDSEADASTSNHDKVESEEINGKPEETVSSNGVQQEDSPIKNAASNNTPAEATTAGDHDNK